MRATSAAGVHTRSHLVDRAQLRKLLGNRRSGHQLDLELAAGADPNGDPALRRRARALTRRGLRHTIAADLERAIERIDRPRRCPSSLETVVERLKAPVAISPEGVARALFLATEWTSPLHRPDFAQELDRDSRAALHAIEHGPQLHD